MRDRFDGAELDDARRGEIETVFYRSRALLEPEELAELDGSIEEIESWLTKAARRFLDEAELFNAIKHGLAIQASESAFSIGTPEQKISHEGPAVRFLQPSDTVEKTWQVETRWISPERLMGETWFLLGLLGQILTIGRSHYLGERIESLRMFRPGALQDLESRRNTVLKEYRLGSTAAQYLLKEDGGRILLGDGSGALLLEEPDFGKIEESLAWWESELAAIEAAARG